MNKETKICSHCKKEFTITPWEFSYYEKVAVPAPTWCASCRMIRRMSCVNGWSLFFRNCDKCGKRTLSAYPPSSKLTVWCQPCWWGDSWDGSEYAMEYDPSKPFLAQLRELSEKTPYVALESEYLTLKDCDYSNALAYSKNCLLISWADYCWNVCHSSLLNDVKDSSDVLRCESSELCYESLGQTKGYRALYSEDCDSCSEVWFSRNCYGCTNVFGCINLRAASYRIFNEQYSKEEYFEKLKEFKLDTRSGIEAVRSQIDDFWNKFPRRSYSGNLFNVNVTGEYVYQSRESSDMYISTGAEHCKNCQFITVAPAKDCVDYSGWGNNAQLIYESTNIGNNVSNVKFSCYCFPNITDTEYSFWVIGGKNNFGCVNLKRKPYSILNKQYEKEEYEKLVAEIKESMKSNPYVDEAGRTWTYGEYFWPGFCKFAYNHSNASKFFPKTREEALAEGYTWNDEADKQNVEATKKGSELPERISDVTDEIVKETIQCTTCEKKYRIAALELQILRSLNLPLPARCPKCREKSRFDRLHRPKLYDRACAKCNKAIVTPFSPDKPDIVYCEACYQQEIV